MSDAESAPTPTHDREGVDPQTLTLFQQNILLVLASTGPQHGLGIKGDLEPLYGHQDMNHSRVYHALDQLVERGLLQKSQRDGRTNDYALTPTGRKTLQADASRRATIVTRMEGRQP
jgi:DNA-binding PadR family transcriptional regulator